MDENTVKPEMITVTNMSQEEFDKRVEEFEKQRKERQMEQQRSGTCPVCKAARQRESRMNMFHQDIISAIHSMRLTSLDSCILCVQKHVSRALVYYEEMLTAKDSGTKDGTAAVNVKMNFLKILGHLGCAIEESDDFPELNQMLITNERAFRYEGISPDWKAIAVEIEKVESTQNDKEANS